MSLDNLRRDVIKLAAAIQQIDEGLSVKDVADAMVSAKQNYVAAQAVPDEKKRSDRLQEARLIIDRSTSANFMCKATEAIGTLKKKIEGDIDSMTGANASLEQCLGCGMD